MTHATLRQACHQNRHRCQEGRFRMDKLKVWWFPFLPAVTLLVGISACGNQPTTEADINFPTALERASEEGNISEPALAGTIAIDGSSTVFPVTRVMARAFQHLYPGVDFTIGVSGT